MILSFHPCFEADSQVILGDRKLNADDQDLIQNAAVIILPQSCSSDLYQTCRRSSAELFPNYEWRFRYPGKVGQSLLFKKLKCPHPKTLPWTSAESLRVACRDAGGFPHGTPFLIKTDMSHEAEGIYLVEDQKALVSALKDISLLEKSGYSGFITQELIPSGGNVLRGVILGESIVTFWKRPERPGRIITTISRGAKIDRDWRPDLQEKGKMEVQRFSAATGINLAALDLVFPLQDPDPQPLLLEINYYFGRQAFGGSLNYYRLLHTVIQEWLEAKGFDPKSVKLV
jgi:ribosomal protein S6--L-glutamate ligase